MDPAEHLMQEARTVAADIYDTSPQPVRGAFAVGAAWALERLAQTNEHQQPPAASRYYHPSEENQNA